jgi:hypothetical protein
MADLTQLTMLKRDVEEWNEWRETHPTTRPSLFRGDLSNASLRDSDLSRADLTDEAQARVREEGRRGAPLLAEELIMPVSGSDEQEHHHRDEGLAPYSEVVVWRRRFYLAIAAVLPLLALMLLCTSRM